MSITTSCSCCEEQINLEDIRDTLCEWCWIDWQKMLACAASNAIKCHCHVPGCTFDAPCNDCKGVIQ